MSGHLQDVLAVLALAAIAVALVADRAGRL